MSAMQVSLWHSVLPLVRQYRQPSDIRLGLHCHTQMRAYGLRQVGDKLVAVVRVGGFMTCCALSVKNISDSRDGLGADGRSIRFRPIESVNDIPTTFALGVPMFNLW